MRNILIIFFFPILSFAQTAPHIPGQFLVQLKNPTTKNSLSPSLSALVPISSGNSIYLAHFVPSKTNEQQLLQQLQQHPNVQAVQYNHILEARERRPDDPKYAQWHWNLEQLGLPAAWEYSTGGLAGQDSIVVAVIDGGCDLQHEDLKNNIWYNHQEIPNDSIDNDENGYVDDYAGWQVEQENDQHLLDGHGTSVAGIIGARGNNGIGMTGINWQVKLMMLSAAEEDLLIESNILKAYQYVLQMRRLYEQTNGEKGAYIVATNLSAGIYNAHPNNFPLWCSIYDSLGQAGILSVGAVVNLDVDLDEQDDMPTSCASEFLIMATNSTQFEQLHSDAAYGLQNVDLAAPGAVYSTRVGDSYNTFGGTSGAAPHVAGAIALLHSYSSTDWQMLQQLTPVEAACAIRDILLISSYRSEAYVGKLRSRGRLDIGRAMELLHLRYRQTEAPITGIDLAVDGQYHFTFRVNETQSDYEWDIVDLLGRRIYQSQFNSGPLGLYEEDVQFNAASRQVYIVRLFSKGKIITSKKIIGS